MRLDIAKITNVLNKIADLTSGDKNIPGVLLDISENSLKLCYTDGHKAFVEKFDVETEEGDRLGQMVVDFDQIKRAILNCQPSGKIKTKEVVISFDEKTITISADQYYEQMNGEDKSDVVISKKQMKVAWFTPDANMKVAILLRMDYNSIFETDSYDEYDKAELIEALAKTSPEKGKIIYLSAKTQTMFVNNQAHATAVPLSKTDELTEDDKVVLFAEVQEANPGLEGEELNAKYTEALENKVKRVNYSVVLSQAHAKALIGILSKVGTNKVQIFTRDKCANIFVDTDEETVGIWLEMPQASKAHTAALDRYNSLGYKTYQMMFMTDFIVDAIKSAITSSKSKGVSDKVKAVFTTDSEGYRVMEFRAGSGAASIDDKYSVRIKDVVDPTNSLDGKEFTMSLSVMLAIVNQLKTDYTTMDFEIAGDGSVYIRLAELNESEYGKAYLQAREETARLCQQSGVEFNADTTPTPVEIKLGLRTGDILGTRQYTILGKAK